MQTPPPAEPARRGSPTPGRRGVLPWALGLAAALAGAWMLTGVLRQCTPGGIIEAGGSGARGLVREGGEQLRATLRTLGDVLKPQVVDTPLVVLRGDDATPKLVVFTHLADVAVDEKDAHWYGSTYARIEAKNCRVQFVVPLDRMRDGDVVLVPGGDGRPARILVVAPRPRVDVEMLAIAPESIEFTERNTGLRYARGWMGLDNRDQLVRQLRPRLLEAVAGPEVRAKAEAAAREFLERRFAGWLRDGLLPGRDVVVDVRWTE